MASDKPKITKEMIRVRATDKSYARGEEYYRGRTLFNMVKRGSMLEGYCEAGSQPQPYHVRAEVSAKGIGESSCTCLYEYGGDCKHIVALLLSYHYQPEEFEEQLPLDETLHAYEKPDLVALIFKMVKRYPDLQALIDLPMASRVTRQTSLNVDGLRKQLKRALSHYDAWDNRGAEDVLASLTDTADEFKKLGDWQNAIAIYRMILEEIENEPEIFYQDERGDIGVAVGEVIQQLGDCLNLPEIADNDAERIVVLETLLSVYLSDLDSDGAEYSDEAEDFVLGYARTGDLPRLRQIFNQRRQASKHTWSRDAYAEFEIQLDALDNVDPEETLNRLREQGLYSMLVGKLLEMKRGDEAVQVVEQHVRGNWERLHELQRLAAAGYNDAAVRLAQQALKANYDRQLVDWLLARLEVQGDRELLFHWRFQRMTHEPSEMHYASVKKAALDLGNWDKVRPELIRHFQKLQKYDMLTIIHLHEEAWDQAWAALEKTPQSTNFYSPVLWSVLDLEVAARSRKALPARSLPVYLKYMRKMIDQRNRESYGKAAEYLLIARELYQEVDDLPSWIALIQNIRVEFKKLPALQDELDKAGL